MYPNDDFEPASNSFTVSAALSLEDHSLFQAYIDGELIFEFNYRNQESWVSPEFFALVPALMMMADNHYSPFIHANN